VITMHGAPHVHVSWFDAWSRELDRALDTLPEMETCSHELYRALAMTTSRARKRFALVREGDGVVAVIALRRRHHHWELLCDGVIPFASAPALPDRLWDAVSALRQYVRVVEWDGEPPDVRDVRFVEREARYAVSTRVDLDAYWSAKGNDEWLGKARRRTEGLGHVELEVDRAGAYAWTIEQWDRKWQADPAGETEAKEDIFAAAHHLAREGAYRSFRLLIDGAAVAGVTAFARGTTLVMMQSYRDPAYDRAGVGVHLDERIYRWAASSPYDTVDLGCGSGYKSRWGEVAGTRTTCAIAPWHLATARVGLGMVRSVVSRSGRAKHDIMRDSGRPQVRNEARTAPFTNREGQDAITDRRTRPHGPLKASDSPEQSRGVHT